MGMKSLGRVGTHMSLFLFQEKKYNFMRFERLFPFQNV